MRFFGPLRLLLENCFLVKMSFKCFPRKLGFFIVSGEKSQEYVFLVIGRYSEVDDILKINCS